MSEMGSCTANGLKFCQSKVKIHKCDGRVWPGVPALVTAIEQQAVSEQAFSTPVLRTRCSAGMVDHFDLQLSDKIEFGGLVWSIESLRRIDSWGKVVVNLACAQLTEDCIEVEVRQWNRQYGCDQEDISELTHRCRAVIHHLESQAVRRMDGQTFEHSYRIYLDPGMAHILTVGHHIVHESRTYDITAVKLLDELGRVPYAEAVSYG